MSVGKIGTRLGFPTISLWSLGELLEASLAEGQTDELTFHNITRMEQEK